MNTEYDETYIERILELGKEGKRRPEYASQLNIPVETFLEWELEHHDFGEACQMAETHAASFWFGCMREKFQSQEYLPLTEAVNMMQSLFPSCHPTLTGGDLAIRRAEQEVERLEALEAAEAARDEARKRVENARKGREASEEARLRSAGWGRADTDPEKRPQIADLLSPPDHHYRVDEDGNRLADDEGGGYPILRIEPKHERDYLNGGRWLYDDSEGKFLWNAPTAETKAKRKDDEKRDAERCREKSRKAAQKQSEQRRADQAARANYVAAIRDGGWK